MTNLFKSTILFLLFTISYSSTAQEVVYIPDSLFLQALIEEGVDTNNDGKIQVTEAENYKNVWLYVYGNFIDITGINNFKNLESFEVQGPFLKSINLDLLDLKNLTLGTEKLEEIVLSIDNLRSFTIYDTPIEVLDVSNLKKLRDLTVDGMLNLQHIEFGDSSNLNNFNLVNSEIKNIDLSNCKELIYFEVSENKIDEFTAKGLEKLEAAFMFENSILSTLDLSNNPSMIGVFIASQQEEINNIVINNSQILEDLVLDTRVQNIYMKGVNINLEKSGIFNLENTKLICADEEQFPFLQSHLDLSSNTTCVLTSFCPTIDQDSPYLITGNAQLDTDQNGCDANDPAIKKLEFSIGFDNEKHNYYVDNSNNYELYFPEGQFTITPNFIDTNYFEITPSAIHADFPSQGDTINQDFCVTAKNGDFKDLNIVIIPKEIARPGFDASYKIKYKNVGNVTMSGEVKVFYEDETMDFLSANPAVSSSESSLLKWEFENLAPLETRVITFSVNLNTPTETPPLNGEDILSFGAQIAPIFGDETPSDNAFNLRQEVVNSFDPNDKTCLEGALIKPSKLGEYMHYKIRFENTGTASAVNIRVADRIDLSKLSLRSIQLVDSSHDVEMKISDGNLVEFLFNNIYLPFDDANNDGYVVFKIRTLSSLQPEVVVANQANIYFDFNEVIVTNNCKTKFGRKLAATDLLAADAVSLLPNPASTHISIDSKYPMSKVTLIDLLGQVVLEEEMNNRSKFDVNIQAINVGVFLVKVETEKGVYFEKLSKLGF